jgi:hypothetical protein
VALTLRLLGGLSTKEVARSFLVAEPAMAHRVGCPNSVGSGCEWRRRARSRSG